MRYGTMMGAVLAAAACPVGAADLPLTQAPPVVVTATRFEEPPLDVPVGVTVVTAEDIRRSTAASLADVLSQYAGIHVRDNTGGPDRQIDLRGFGITGDQNTLVLVNGQRLSGIELVSPSLSAIPLDAVERIEIVRGSGAVLYGAGATGGTINLITRTAPAGARSARLQGGGGSYGSRELRAAAEAAGARVGVAASASHLDSDNYRDNNRLRQSSAEVDLRAGDAARYLSVKLGGEGQDLRNPGARNAAQLVADRRGATTPDDYSSRDGTRLNVGAGWRLAGGGDAALNLTWRRREARAAQSFFGAVSRLTTRVETAALQPRLRLPFEAAGRPHSLVIGADADAWDYDSQFAGGFFNSVADATQRNRALYLQDSVQLTPALRLLAGARWQRTANTVSERVPLPAAASRDDSLRAYELAVRRQVGARAALFGKLGRSFRVATVDENRFRPTLLAPQTSRDAEIGGELETRGLRLRAALYRMRIENEIYFSPLFPPFGANVNLSPTRRQGIEFDARWRRAGPFSVHASAALLDAEFRSGVYGGVDVSGNRIPLVPRRMATLGGAWRFTPRATLAVTARHVGRQRFDNDQANTFMPMPSYTTLDAKLEHAAGPWRVAVSVLNLAGRRYYTYGIRNAAGTDFNAYPAPERAVFLSAQYRLR